MFVKENKKHIFKKGFTLMEMLIVVILLGVIATFTIKVDTHINASQKLGFVLLDGDFMEINLQNSKIYRIKDYNNNSKLDDYDYNNKQLEQVRITQKNNNYYWLWLLKIPKGDDCIVWNKLLLKQEGGILYCYDKNSQTITKLFWIVPF